MLAYLKKQTTDAIFISAWTIGEVEAGIERQRSQNVAFATELEQWRVVMELQFAHCILPVTPAISQPDHRDAQPQTFRAHRRTCVEFF